MKYPNPRLRLSATALPWLAATLVSAQTSTLPVADINVKTAGSAPAGASMVKVNIGTQAAPQEILVLSIDETLTGQELWRGDIQGATVNLSLIKDINTGASSSTPSELTTVGNQVFFTAKQTDAARRGLWATGGTAATTRLVMAAPTSGSGTEPTKLLAFKNAANEEQLIFEGFGADADDIARNSDNNDQNDVNVPSLGRELWRSNGTAAGTRRLTNINPINGGLSDAAHFLVHPASSSLYFTADNGTQGRELWKINFSNTAGAVMLKDLEPNASTPFPAGLNPELTALNNQANSRILFVADTEAANGAEDAELWITDGAVNGVMTVLKEIRPGAGGSTPRSMKMMTITGSQANTYLYFTADDGTNGRELWRTNGQTGAQNETVMLRNIRSGAQDGFETITNPNGTTEFWDQLTVVNDYLFFVANDGSSGAELYRSNGRTGDSNTLLVQNIASGATSSNPRNLTPFDNKLVFTATTVVSGNNRTGMYFATAAATGGATLLQDFAAERTISHLTRIGTQLYFLVDGAELWKTDVATVAGTVRVKNFRTGTAGSSASELSTTAEGITYFSATDGNAGLELWKTDGTGAGTSMVSDIRTGAAGSSPRSIIQAGSKVFFSADSTGSNRELWMTDGTALGTEVVLTQSESGNIEINTTGSSDPQQMASIDGLLYFSATNSTFGREPWRSDGTPAGTQMIGNLVGAGGSSNPENFIKYKTDVYFIAAATGEQPRLRKVSAITESTAPSIGLVNNVKELTVFGTGTNHKIYFAGVGSVGSRGRELWSSDGTGEGTTLVKDINTTNSSNSNPTGLTVVGSNLYFAANDGILGTELWRTNGTEAGTVLVKDINTIADSAPGSTEDSAPQQLIEAGGKLFFTADNGVNGRELWVSGIGTATTTFMVKDIVPGAGSPDIQDMRNVDGVLCFSADDGINGRELWISDGTAAGTVMINDLTGPSATSSPGNFTGLNGQLLYTATDREYGNELRLFAIGAKVQLEYPAETVLTANAIVDFGSVDFKKSATQNIVIKNIGIATLSDIKPLISGINASEFTFVTPKAATSLQGTVATSFGVKFTPKEGGLRTATLSIFSSDVSQNPFILQLNGTGNKDPYISDHPESLIVKVGQSATFTAEATSLNPATDPLTLQWKKGTANIAGAVSTSTTSPVTSSYTIPSVTLKDGGVFILSAKNKALTGLSNGAELGVVEDYAQPLVIVAGMGKSAIFKVNAAGNQLTYQWLKNNVPLVNDARIAGATTKTMTIKNLVGTDTDIYTCRVSNPAGSQIGGNTQLNIFTEKPDVSDDQNMPDSVIGGDYVHQVIVLGLPQKAPLTYSVKNLPTGLKLDSKTGKITGRPTKAGTFPVILTATNTFGSDSSTEQSVDIEALPSGIEGIYTGVVEHKALINKHLGGRLDLTVTKTGAYTGSLTLGATKLPIKGAVDTFRTDDVANPRPKFHLDIKPAASTGLPALIGLDVEIDRASGLLTDSVVTTAGESAAITGWRNADAVAALHYEGTYNFGLELGAPEQIGAAFADKVPQGWSFGTLKSAKGKVTLAGRTADGDKITGSSFVGVTGKVVVFQTMYTPLKGSLAGSITIDPKNTDVVTDNVITSADDIKWVRPADPKSKTRTYVAGFGMPGTPVESPVSLEASGSIFIKPVGTALVYDMDPNPSNTTGIGMDVDFLLGGISTADPNGIDAKVLVNPGHKIVAVDSPTAGTKLTITGTTGAFTGTFTLSDPDPLGGTKPIVRKVTYQGMIIKDDLGVVSGVGFFTLPQLPQTGQTITTSPIFGGSVLLTPTGENIPPP